MDGIPGYDRWKLRSDREGEADDPPTEEEPEMEREWMRDIRACEGCGEQVYDGARYQKGTGQYLGWLCLDCLEFVNRENEGDPQ